MHTLSLSRSLFSGDSPYHIPSVNDQPMHYEFGVSCLGVATATDTPVRSPSFHDWPKSEGRCLFHQCFVQRDLHSHHTFVTTMVLHLYLYCLPWCLSTAHWRFESMRLLWHLEKKIISLSIFYIYMYFFYGILDCSITQTLKKHTAHKEVVFLENGNCDLCLGNMCRVYQWCTF